MTILDILARVDDRISVGIDRSAQHHRAAWILATLALLVATLVALQAALQ